MKCLVVLIGLLVAPGSAAAAQCLPADSDVVSLGEKAARAYGERSLNKHIAERSLAIESRGEKVSRIVKRSMDCKPFPNLLGADEWRCVGSARVCTGK
jgi:hypothetical protein